MVAWLLDPQIHCYLVALSFVGAGLLHFIKVEFFMSIMPDYFPWHRTLVWISGIAEMAGGVGMLIPSVRIWAVYGLIALLLAVFPANIDMAAKAYRKKGLTAYTWLLLLRLPLQFVLIYWVWWAGTNV
jgi:uncharacterized membrane protein